MDLARVGRVACTGLVLILLWMALSSCGKRVPPPLPPPSFGAWPELPTEATLEINVADGVEDVSKTQMGFLAAVQADGTTREAEGSSLLLVLDNPVNRETPVIVLTTYQNALLKPEEGDLQLQPDGSVAGRIAPMGRAVLRVTAAAVGEPSEPGELIEIHSPSAVDLVQAWIVPLLGEWRPTGRDGEQLDLGMVAVHAALLRDGDSIQALFFSPPRQKNRDGSLKRRPPFDKRGGGYYWRLSQINDVEIALWDMATGEVEERPMGTPQNLFCSGHARLADGRLLVVGGHVGIFAHNADRLHLFDPSPSNPGEWWLRLNERLPETRWYPTVTMLPDAKMLITSGRGAPLLGNFIDQILGWYRTARREYEIFDPTANALLDIPQSEKTFIDDEKLATYPSVIVLPTGGRHPKGLVFVQERNNAWLFSYDPGRGRLTQEAGPYRMSSKGSRSYPYYGSAALLPFQEGDTKFRVLILGGQHEDNDNHEDYNEDQMPTRTAEIFDLDLELAPDSQSGWRRTDPLGQARLLPTATHLADGTVLVTGGTRRGWANCNSGVILLSELFDPHSETFQLMAPAAVERRYHSTAMLLPDATLLSAGSTGGYNLNNSCIDPRFVAERYYPPYLWKGPRPVIASLSPAEIQYGGQWEVRVESGQLEGLRAALVRLASVTHGNHMDQHYLRLSESGRQPAPGGAILTIPAPSNGSVAPPGDYMLFVVDGAGVPSQAHLVRISAP